MQSTLFRQTSRQLAPSIKNSNLGFFKRVVTDSGNIPIISANLTACALLITFASRKLFFHPDIGISDANRFSQEIQNESATRLDDALTFRGQTRSFARFLTGDEKSQNAFSPTNIIMEFATGNKPNEKFQLGFLKKTDITLPLESTDYFDDGLFVGNSSDNYSANLPNDKDFAC